MTQRTDGLYAFLSQTACYQGVQALVGAEKLQAILVQDYLVPLLLTRKALLSPAGKILLIDVGCGPAPSLAYLPEWVNYIGYDMNQNYLTSAKKRYGNRGEFHCQLFDASCELPLQSADVVLAVGLLHHLSDDIAKTLCQTAYQSLKPGGWLVTLDGCYVDNQNPIARWFVSRDRGECIRPATAYADLIQYVFPKVELTVRNNLLHIPYNHAIVMAQKPL